MAAPSLDQIAKRHADAGVGSVFVYTHEAHPGENYPHLTSMEQKQAHAQSLRTVYGVERPILLDALTGDCHRAYGSMPNMSWIVNRAGIPLYKSDWTDADSIENALTYHLAVLQRRSHPERLAPFRVERLDFRNVDREAFYGGLERNGPKAVREFQEAFD